MNNWIRQKLQNKESYSESPELSPVLALSIFEKSIATNLRYIRSLDYIFLYTNVDKLQYCILYTVNPQTITRI